MGTAVGTAVGGKGGIGVSVAAVVGSIVGIGVVITVGSAARASDVGGGVVPVTKTGTTAVAGFVAMRVTLIDSGVQQASKQQPQNMMSTFRKRFIPTPHLFANDFNHV